MSVAETHESRLVVAPSHPSDDAVAAAALSGVPMNPRTRMLIEAPIAATLVRLAAPNVLVMVAQASVGLIETYFVGQLGTDALAGVSLVFPAVMLMQMMSAGAMGGGISSAIARALLAADAAPTPTRWCCTRWPSRWFSASHSWPPC